MRTLSNFAQNENAPGSVAAPRPARPDEIHDALAVILGAEAPAGPDQVLDFLRFAAERRINLRDLWVIEHAGRVAWAILPIISPGHTALLFAPAFRPRDIGVAPLIETVCDVMAGRGVHLVQALVDPSDQAGRILYADQQFCEMAELLYAHTAIARAVPPVELPAGFWWQTYTAANHAQFERVIQQSYEQSLDCPALNGMRAIGDVIAGHKASGEFDPRFWFLLTEAQTPRAALLLSRVPRTDMAELVYLGLAPAVRGRGVGDLMIRHAFHAVREMNLSRLTLAVDSKNTPALRLYFRHGMQRVGSKIAMMRDLRAS